MSGGQPTTAACWRHPRPQGAEGRCIGRVDLPVDPRRARRLAYRIRSAARRERRPAVVITSPLRRCRAVGRWLARWGWRHRVDDDLLEFDFGDWDGRRWPAIGPEPLDRWIADFVDHRPGGGESVGALLRRCERFVGRLPEAGVSVVTHGGWLSALAWLGAHARTAGARPTADTWPAAPAYATRLRPAAPADAQDGSNS
jgi:alpha-ribazole phosphatase